MTPSPQATAAQQQLATAVTPTPEEQAYMSSILAALQQRLPFLQGRAGETGSQLFGDIGPESLQFRNLITGQAANPTQLSFENLFDPLFQQARQSVAASANQRGIVGSGLELENLGRAGVELALGQAQARTQNALLNEELRQRAVANLGALVGTEGGLSDQARAELADFLARGQAASSDIKARQAGGLATNVGATQGLGTTTTTQTSKQPFNFGALGSALGSLAAAPFTGGSSLAGLPGSLRVFSNPLPPTSFGSPGYAGAGYANYPTLYQPPQQPSGIQAYLDRFRLGPYQYT